MVRPNQHTEQILIMKLAIPNGQSMLVLHRPSVRRNSLGCSFLSVLVQKFSVNFDELH